jgi:hypothetical protein
MLDKIGDALDATQIAHRFFCPFTLIVDLIVRLNQTFQRNAAVPYTTAASRAISESGL